MASAESRMNPTSTPNPLLRKEGALYAWRERIGLDARLVAQWGAVGLNPSAGEPAAECPPAWALCMH